MTLRQGEKKHYNNKVDAYSFAIVLWELILNKLPFEGMSNLQAAYAAAFKVTLMSHFGCEWQLVIERVLSPNRLVFLGWVFFMNDMIVLDNENNYDWFIC